MRNKIIIFLAAVLFQSCAGIQHRGETMIIQPDHASISYSGRIDFKDAKAPVFDWPGILIRLGFEGSRTCYVILEDSGGNDFNIIIDGRQEGVIEAKAGRQKYKVSEGLGQGAHSVVICKRTESYDGKTVFGGFILDKDAVPLPAAEKPALKIEFIGDSLSVGYGVEGKGIKCESERKYKNNYLAFTAVAARKLNADYNVVAISGRGVVRNYGEKNKVSSEPLPLYYGRTVMNDASSKWDFKKWQADIVAINLGTNDFSTEPKPDEEVFIKSYHELVKRARKAYPKAHIFICAGPTQMDPFYACMEKLFGRIKDSRVHRVDMAGLTEKDWGCDYHPNISAAERMAGELVSAVKLGMKM